MVKQWPLDCGFPSDRMREISILPSKRSLVRGSSALEASRLLRLLTTESGTLSPFVAPRRSRPVTELLCRASVVGMMPVHEPQAEVHFINMAPRKRTHTADLNIRRKVLQHMALGGRSRRCNHVV